MKKEIYLGLYLSGLKRDKSRLIVVEKYEQQKRLVVSKIESQFKSDVQNNYPDELLKEEISSFKSVKSIGVNYPTTKPPCVDCKLDCPGVKNCEVEEVKWMTKEYKKRQNLTLDSKKEVKAPVPYIERAVDYYVSQLLEEKFDFEPAFAPNRIGFFARGQFLKKSFSKKTKVIEVSTKASLWRIGNKLGVRRTVLRNFYKSGLAVEQREIFLKKLEKDFFLYDEDHQILLKSKQAFESLLCALSAYYFEEGKIERMPKRVLGPHLNFALPLD